MSSLSSLPDEVLKLLMQHVPLKDRLTSGCLVNRRLHAAAIAATECLELLPIASQDRTSREYEDCSVEWLSHYGQHLTSLKLVRFVRPLQQLPCPNLAELELCGCSVQLGAADGQPGVIQDCTKLTRLQLLNKCEIVDAVEGNPLEGGLSCLVHLQQLIVGPRDGMTYDGVSHATLPRLGNLTHLCFDNLSTANLLQLSHLTSLQELRLSADVDVGVVGPSNVPGLVLPGSLTSLWLNQQCEAALLSLVPTGLQKLIVECVVEGPAEGPGSFLSCMARLQHLTELLLTECEDLAMPPASPAYSALTASSKLVALDLSGILFPLGVWPHIFSATRRLPHLTSLTTGVAVDEFRTVSMGAADFSSLVSCCPGLCCIDHLFLQPGLHVSELHKLSALTQLYLRYNSDVSVSCEESMRGLAAVTQLRHLNLFQWIPSFKIVSLLPLTSLTALTKLDFDWRSADPSGRVSMNLQAGSAPDVWLQLLERCAADPDSQPTVLRSLAQQLAEQRALTAQQASNQQQRMVAQEQQIAGLQGQLQQLHAAVQQLLHTHRH